MQIINTIEKVRSQIRQAKSRNRLVAFVPTMGNLHEGHLSLVKKAREMAGYVVVSIFVNPLQFGPNEDFDQYPRTFENDRKLLESLDIDMVFVPDSSLIYPEGKDRHTQVSVDFFDGIHCGASRPCFFTGVATIVLKLFNIITPDVAIFGEKDFQQITIIKKMTRDLALPIKIVGIPTVRNSSGLALSSRNKYLDESQKEKAPFLYQLLKNVASRIVNGDRDYQKLSRDSLCQMEQSGFSPDYFNIVSQDTLRLPDGNDKALVILAACKLGKTRLIDNIQLQLD